MPGGSGAASPNDTLFSFELQHSTDGKSRKIWGVASTEDRDREKEIISEGAITKALTDFMTLPIIHWYHTERPIGWLEKAKYGDVRDIVQELGIHTNVDDLPDRGLVVMGELKNTPDTDDVWNAIEKGIVSEWSICGTRRSGSPECDVPTHRRTSPCITKAMYLWSISLCPRGTGQNRSNFAAIVKAMTSGGSSLIHSTVDGTRRITKMDETAAGPGPTGDDGSQGPVDPLQEILAKLTAIADHLGVGGGESPEGEDELPPIPGPTANDEIEKGEGPVDVKTGADPDIDGSKDIKKAADIMKAQTLRISELEAANTALSSEIDALKKKTPQVKTLVMDPNLAKGAKPQLNGKTHPTPGKTSNLARLNQVLSR